MNLSQDSNFACLIKYRHYFAGSIIGYLLEKINELLVIKTSIL